MSSRAVVLTLLLLPATAHVAPAPVAPIVIDAADTALVRRSGLLVLRNAPFTGRLIEHDSLGAVIAATAYRAGRRDGVAEAWYGSGAPRYRRHYVEGREEGEHAGWWEDGRVHFAYHYRHGLIEGEARELFPDGTPYRDYHYVAGQEEGSQKMWYADGTLRSNYVVRDGRRYGLPGTKGCAGRDTVVSRESRVAKGLPQ